MGCEDGVLRVREPAPRLGAFLGLACAGEGRRRDCQAAATQPMRVTTAGNPPLDPHG